MLLDKIILDICSYEYEYFLRKANVQGVGLGYKIVNGCTTLERAIQIYVSKKVNKIYLSIDNLVPTYYKGIKTDVIETGFFTVGNDLIEPSNELTGRVRPVTGGYSVGPAKIDKSSTYGSMVTDGSKYYMLGNNHSLAQNNSLPLGYPILQPGVYDGGRIEYDMISRLSRFVPLKPKTFFFPPANYVDCAIAEILTPGTVSPEITFIGKPTGITNPTLDLEIQGTGRTSGYISAKIVAIGVTLTVENPLLGDVLFKDQFTIDFPRQKTGGNSGALIMNSAKKAVGMLMASCPTFCACNPIQTVLDSLNVSLVL